MQVSKASSLNRNLLIDSQPVRHNTYKISSQLDKNHGMKEPLTVQCSCDSVRTLLGDMPMDEAMPGHK